MRIALRLVVPLLLALTLVPVSRGFTPGAQPLEPTEYEQYLLELMNRARLDPPGEAARFGIDLNEGLDPGTLSPDPRPPLAFDLRAGRVARDHTVDLLDNLDSTFFMTHPHEGSDGRMPWDRLDDALVPYSGMSENNAWVTGGAISKASVDGMHALLFKDFTSSFEVVGRGHRKVILNADRNVVGIGALAGIFGTKKASVCTEDLIQNGKVFLTGVVYADTVLRDGFYTPGEGLSGVTVTATRAAPAATLQTTTMMAGGYAIEVTAGTWNLSVTGGPLGATEMQNNGHVIGTANRKVDFVHGGIAPSVMPAFTLVAGAGKGAPGAWALALKKGVISTGQRSFAPADLDALVVYVDGIAFFGLAGRASTKTKLDKLSGEIAAVTIRDAAGNSLAIDLLKRSIKMNLKSAPGIDPADGHVDVVVDLPGFRADLRSKSVVTGTKVVLKPATAEIVRY